MKIGKTQQLKNDSIKTEEEVPIMRTEADIDKYYSFVKNERGQFVTEAKQTGKHNYYSWRAQLTDDCVFEGKMAIPSVRFYFVTSSKKGVYVEVDKTKTYAKAGTHNIFFGKEECYGKDILVKDDKVEAITIAISETQFAELTNRYPETMGSFYQKYQERGNSFLSQEKGFLTSLEMYTVLQQLKNSHLLGKGADVYADLKIMELFLLQLQLHSCSYSYQYCKTQLDIDKMYEVRERIVTDLQYTPSISELAREVGMNEKKLCYGFKEVFGNTIFGELYNYKMNFAQQLLLHTDKSVSEIALQCGYEHLSHFSTAFKRKFGITPQQVRGNYQ